jgi:hypothetical protein
MDDKDKKELLDLIWKIFKSNKYEQDSSLPKSYLIESYAQQLSLAINKIARREKC